MIDFQENQIKTLQEAMNSQVIISTTGVTYWLFILNFDKNYLFVQTRI